MRGLLVRCSLAAAFVCASLATGAAAFAADCPEGGTVRFGVEPYEASARLTPVYESLSKLLAAKIGCPVDVFITPSYNAEIEAMRNGKLDVAEFGPLGYVFAHELAGADVFATYDDANGNPSTYTASIVTWKGSGLSTLKDVVGRSFAYSDPASTSGHLFPAYALRKNGIDPDAAVKPVYAGSHTSSFEAIRNHKVDAGELNSQEIDAATQVGEYAAGDYLTLWRSAPIPNDPVAIRRTLPAPLKKRIVDAFMTLDFSQLPPDLVKVLPAKGTTKYISQSDSAYDQVRDLVKTMNFDQANLDH
ncbi:MAG: phosphate/phosphite/phosphonate ABC transporter substrate-binding protein [Vulcanimicrobiaceae bacterium]